MVRNSNKIHNLLLKWRHVAAAVLVGSATMQTAGAATPVPKNWSVDMSFFFNVPTAPGQVSQDPLALTVGASTTAVSTKLKPPLPPGMAKTNNAGYPLLDAFMTEGGQRVFNKVSTPDGEGRTAYSVKVTAEEAGASVSLTIDCSGLDPAVTLNLVHSRTLKRQKVTRDLCTGANNTLTLNDFLEVVDPAVAEEVFVVGALDGGGFVGKTQSGKVIGVLTSDNAQGSFNGVQLTIGGQSVLLNSDGTFDAGNLAGLQAVRFSRKGHLTQAVTASLDGDPIPLPNLTGGDAFPDNKIDLRDLSFIKKQFNMTSLTCYDDLQNMDGCGDVNGDQKVDLRDLSILKKNFLSVGDP